jgi:6-phosphofructokinase 2
VIPDFCQRVADICSDLDAVLILDTSGCGLTGITRGVFVLKPRLRKLREFAGRPLEYEADRVTAAHELIERDWPKRLRCRRVYTSGVGAGDATVAGITVGSSAAVLNSAAPAAS